MWKHDEIWDALFTFLLNWCSSVFRLKRAWAAVTDINLKNLHGSQFFEKSVEVWGYVSDEVNNNELLKLDIASKVSQS